MSTYAFLDRSLEKLPQGTKGGAEMAELLGKAQLANVQQNIAQIISLLYCSNLSSFASTSGPCILLRDYGRSNIAKQLLKDTESLKELAVRGNEVDQHW
jgi:hypothetical protein